MKKKIIRLVGYAVMLLCFGFLGREIWIRKPDFSQIRHPLTAVLLGLALTAAFAGLVYLSAAAWKATLQFLHGKRLRYRMIAPVYTRSNIAKYLPGNFMHFAGRNLLAGRLGFSQMDIAFSTVTEVAVLILTACIWSAVLASARFSAVLGGAFGRLAAHRLTAAGAALFLLTMLTVFVLLVRRGGYWGKYRKFFTPGFFRLLGRLFVLYSVTLLLPGVFMLLMFVVLFGYSPALPAMMLTVAAYTVSWVAGYITPGVPGGLGVRESILLLMLGPVYPGSLILIVAVLHRILSILGDAAAFVVCPLVFGRGEAAQPDGTSAPV